VTPFHHIRTADGAPWLERAARAVPGLRHALTTEAGPDLRGDPGAPDHADAVAALAAHAGLPHAAWVRQVHGGTVLRADAPGCGGEADALWTDRPGLGVVGRGADCPIVVVAGTRADGGPLWGMAHASWRSTLAGIVTGLMEALTGAGLEPATAAAAVAPSAGPCCYEVGEEVRAAFLAGLGPHAGAFFRETGRRPRLDLWAANVDALARAGVAPERVAVDGRCTLCGRGFPSYRRQGDDAGRMGVLVGVVPET